MFQHTYSALLSGLSGILTEVECSISGGLPNFHIVGIPAAAAASARERIRSALKSSGFSLPPSRITVNIRPLRPGQPIVPGSCTALDLPIALALLACQQLIPSAALETTLFLGELSLSGLIKPLSGALSLAYCTRQTSIRCILLPDTNAAEAALAGHCPALPLTSLTDAVQYLRHQLSLTPAQPAKPETVSVSSPLDSIHGQDIGKRALTIAAAGMHNLLFIGPPGCGKTLLAQSLPSLLPPLTYSQKIDLTEIYSSCCLLPPGQSLLQQRPFRAPHHTISAASLVGGGAIPRPGEVTLAHHGILYLDELPEFSRSALESMRQPLEDHQITLNRLRTSIRFPADFLLIASMNPCPCGYFPDTQLCRCTPARIQQYYSKVHSPLLDRIDMILYLSPVPIGTDRSASAISSEDARCQIAYAQKLQSDRLGSSVYNARMSLAQIPVYCSLSPNDEVFMEKAYAHYHLSLRAYHKILRVSRTIADLEGAAQIRREHLLEALQYRLAPGVAPQSR